MHKHIIKAEKPIETKIGQKQYISFSFELLHDVSYTECNESSFFINLLQRHSFGYEKISIKSIKKDISIAKGIDYLFSFRATGSNHVFLGFREGNVFKVVFIESKFGDIYNHD